MVAARGSRTSGGLGLLLPRARSRSSVETSTEQNVVREFAATCGVWAASEMKNNIQLVTNRKKMYCTAMHELAPLHGVVVNNAARRNRELVAFLSSKGRLIVAWVFAT
jgi:hypothetical protein